MDIHLAAEHGINVSYRQGDRSNLGSGPAATQAQIEEERRQLQAFQQKTTTKEMQAEVRMQ
jgi:hypothetical protein